MERAGGGGALDGPAQGDLWTRRSVMRSGPFVLLRQRRVGRGVRGARAGRSWAENSLRLLPILRHFTLLLRHAFGAVMWNMTGALTLARFSSAGEAVSVFVSLRNALMCWSVDSHGGQDTMCVCVCVFQSCPSETSEINNAWPFASLVCVCAGESVKWIYF